MSNKSLLIIGKVWPEPKSSAAGARMMQLVRAFQEHEYEVRFYSTAQKTGFEEDLSKFNVTTKSIAINDSAVDDLFLNLKPDVVLFDRFMTEEQFGWRIAEQCPNAVRVLDTEDLHFLRKAREKAVKKEMEVTESDLKSDLALREIASVYRCDLSLMISEAEMSILRDTFQIPSSLLLYTPYLLDESEMKSSHDLPEFHQRKDVMTIGNCLHAPNADAVRYLYNEIWPLIREKLPDLRMHVYGAYPKESLRQFHQPEKGFLFHGRVDNADEVIVKSRLLLAPIRFGAGLKGKLIDAMRCRTPSVTTTMGAEGIAGEANWAGRIVDESNDFAEAVVALAAHETAWRKAQKRCPEILSARFDRSQFEDTMIDRIQEIGDHLNVCRTANFTGQMLGFHTMRSTKYLSRWIEEKNKMRKTTD